MPADIKCNIDKNINAVCISTEPEPASPFTHTYTPTPSAYTARSHAKADCPQLWGDFCDDRPDEPDASVDLVQSESTDDDNDDGDDHYESADEYDDDYILSDDEYYDTDLN